MDNCELLIPVWATATDFLFSCSYMEGGNIFNLHLNMLQNFLKTPPSEFKLGLKHEIKSHFSFQILNILYNIIGRTFKKLIDSDHFEGIKT